MSSATAATTTPTPNGFGGGGISGSNFLENYSRFEQEVLLQKSLNKDSSSSSVVPAASSSSKPKSKSEFYVKASAIAQEINTTSDKLYNLARLVRKKDTFNEYNEDIQELTYIIKERIATHNATLEDLQTWMSSASSTASSSSSASTTEKQSKQHSANVVTLMKARLMDTAKEFKEVLQSRTKSIKATDDRRSKLSFGGGAISSSGGVNPGSSFSTRLNKREHSSHTVLDLSNNNNNSSSSNIVNVDSANQVAVQQQMRDSTDDYINARTNSMREIESTIVELSSMFSQLAHMVAEQEETVRRIGDDVETAVTNVEEGQNQLLEYLKKISSNRGLILKIFFVLVIFIIFFAVFVLR